MPDSHRVLSARDVMTRKLVTVRPQLGIFDAIDLLLKNSISGAPVVDERGRLIGMLSEVDCLNVLASGEFHQSDQRETGTVADYMSKGGRTISPDTDLYAIAHYFITQGLRRYPVVDGESLVGQVSRRDVLRGIKRMAKERAPRKHYPDYREPGDGPQRSR